MQTIMQCYTVEVLSSTFERKHIGLVGILDGRAILSVGIHFTKLNTYS